MSFLKFSLVIAVIVGHVSAKGYNTGLRSGGNVATQPGSRPGYGGGVQPNRGGENPGDLTQSKIGGGTWGSISNLGGQSPSNRGSGVPSQIGNNYGPIGQTPIDVGSQIGDRIPSNVGGSLPSNVGGRPAYGNIGRQSPNKEETFPPRPFNMDYNIVDEQGNAQFRREEGDGAGNVRGTYGYRNTQGLYRTVEYVSNKDGFKAKVDTNEPGTDGKESPADVTMNVEKTPAGIQEQYNNRRNGNQGQNIYQGGQTNQYNLGAGAVPSTGGIGNIGGAGDRGVPMPGMKPNKGSPDLPAGVNPGGRNGPQNFAQQSKIKY